MSASFQLRLGSQELLRLASAVSATEPGLVTGAQVAAFIREYLQNLTLQYLTLDATDYNEVLHIDAPKGASFSLQGGDAALSLMLENGTLYIGETTANSSNVYFNIPVCFQGGFDVFGGTPGQVLTKTTLNAVWADAPSSGSVSGQSYYEDAAAPHMHAARTTLPSGWYGVELILNSDNGGDCNYLLNPAAVSSSHIRNVMGLAYGGTDNSSCPYTTYNGVEWVDYCGAPVSRPMASVLRMSFLYHHTGSSLAWPSDSFKTPYSEWSKGSVRYTGIPEPQSLTAS